MMSTTDHPADDQATDDVTITLTLARERAERLSYMLGDARDNF